MIKFSNKSLLTLALVLAICVAALVYNFLNSVQTGISSKEDTTIVVAKGEILANSLITEEMIEEMVVPRQTVVPGAITSRTKVVGSYAKQIIPAGEQITEGKILDIKSGGFSGYIPSDKRAISIAVSDVTGVGQGLIKPGDYVDVIAVLDGGANSGPVANMILQNILILATNKIPTREEQGALTKDSQLMMVTLAVTPDEALSVGLAAKNGTMTLALRPQMSSSFAQVGIKTIDNLVGNAVYVKAVSSPAVPAPSSVPMPNLSGLMQSLFPNASGVKPKVDNHGFKKVIPVIKGTNTQDVYVE